MTESDTPLRIKSIKVTGLFGLYNHDITLKDERVTVIHGPNGVGKTVLLKLIYDFFRGRYNEILKVPLDSFEIRFCDNRVVLLNKQFNSVEKVERILLNFGHTENGIICWDVEWDFQKQTPIEFITQAQIIDFHGSLLQSVGVDKWLVEENNEIISTPHLFQLFDEPNLLRQFRKRIDTHLIETQRLIHTPQKTKDLLEPPSIDTVQAYTRDLLQQMESTMADYAKHSQKLDQTFPQRLLQGTTSVLNIDQLKQELRHIEKTRKHLQDLGILEGDDTSTEANSLQMSKLDDFQPAQLPVMSVYVHDTKQKLAILEDLSARIEILLKVLNKKFINKQLRISRNAGLAITGKDGKPIAINALSSGEQHELVLLYDLLFKVKPNTLVLIDEPELSLHISWQKDFMDDLLEIIRLAQFDVLVATHSPYIVGEHSELLEILYSDT